MADIGSDVLIVRPSIVDLDSVAPDIQASGRTGTFTGSTGAMTRRLELLDPSTGAVLGRVIDRQQAKDTGQSRLSTVVGNTGEADCILRRWASQVHGLLERTAE